MNYNPSTNDTMIIFLDGFVSNENEIDLFIFNMHKKSGINPKIFLSMPETKLSYDLDIIYDNLFSRIYGPSMITSLLQGYSQFPNFLIPKLQLENFKIQLLHDKLPVYIIAAQPKISFDNKLKPFIMIVSNVGGILVASLQMHFINLNVDDINSFFNFAPNPKQIKG